MVPVLVPIQMLDVEQQTSIHLGSTLKEMDESGVKNTTPADTIPVVDASHVPGMQYIFESYDCYLISLMDL